MFFFCIMLVKIALYILVCEGTVCFCFSITQRDDHYEVFDNVYEEVESISKFNFGQNSRKRKGAPKSKC